MPYTVWWVTMRWNLPGGADVCYRGYWTAWFQKSLSSSSSSSSSSCLPLPVSLSSRSLFQYGECTNRRMDAGTAPRAKTCTFNPKFNLCAKVRFRAYGRIPWKFTKPTTEFRMHGCIRDAWTKSSTMRVSVRADAAVESLYSFVMVLVLQGILVAVQADSRLVNAASDRMQNEASASSVYCHSTSTWGGGETKSWGGGPGTCTVRYMVLLLR